MGHHPAKEAGTRGVKEIHLDLFGLLTLKPILHFCLGSDGHHLKSYLISNGVRPNGAVTEKLWPSLNNVV